MVGLSPKPATSCVPSIDCITASDGGTAVIDYPAVGAGWGNCGSGNALVTAPQNCCAKVSRPGLAPAGWAAVCACNACAMCNSTENTVMIRPSCGLDAERS